MSVRDDFLPNLTTKNFIILFVGALGLLFIAVITSALLVESRVFAQYVDAADFYIIQDYVYVAVLLLGLYVLGIKVAKLRLADMGFRSCSFDWIIRAFLLGVILYALRGLLDEVVYSLAGLRRMLEPAQTDVAILKGLSAPMTIAFVFAVCVITPIATEVFQRGILFAWMRRNFNFMLSAIPSGAILGVFHIELVRYFPIIIYGILVAYFYERTRSIWPCIVFHATIGCAYTLELFGTLGLLP